MTLGKTLQIPAVAAGSANGQSSPDKTGTSMAAPADLRRTFSRPCDDPRPDGEVDKSKPSSPREPEPATKSAKLFNKRTKLNDYRRYLLKNQ